MHSCDLRSMLRFSQITNEIVSLKPPRASDTCRMHGDRQHVLNLARPLENHRLCTVLVGIVVVHGLVLLAPAIVLPLVIDRAFGLGFGGMMVLCLGENVLHTTEGSVSRIDRVLASITGLALLILVWCALFESGSSSRFFFVGSVALVVMGIGMRLFAMRRLADRFRTDARPLRAAEKIERSGIYLLRHPSEIGLLLLGLGLATLRGHAGIVIFFGVLLPASIVRITREELFRDSQHLRC
jgi:protein-S-isoprenylcysteine O-methyltransferase Ste14